MNEGLLAYGSGEAPNPFREPGVRSARTAATNPAWTTRRCTRIVPFNREKNTLEVQDVGLTSLYICRLPWRLPSWPACWNARPRRTNWSGAPPVFSAALDTLWVEKRGYYLNYRTDIERFSERRSPTLFYPLLAGAAIPERAVRLIEHLRNPEEFWGEWLIPSISRDDPAFARQRYWKGAIWPPLNFLTYLGLRNAGDHRTAGELARRSLDMFLAEWRRKGM